MYDSKTALICDSSNANSVSNTDTAFQSDSPLIGLFDDDSDNESDTTPVKDSFESLQNKAALLKEGDNPSELIKQIARADLKSDIARESLIKTISAQTGCGKRPIASELKQAISEFKKTQLSPADDVISFWQFDDKGFIQLIPSKYCALLNRNGFCKYTPEYDKGEPPPSILCRINNNRLIQINTTVIEDFIKDYVTKHCILVLDTVLNNTSKLFSLDNWLVGLNTVTMRMHKDTAASSFAYFQNCYVEITPVAITPKEYSELDGVIWQDSVLPRDFSFLNSTEYLDCEFARFQMNNCKSTRGEQTDKDKEVSTLRLKALRSAIGYLMHRYCAKSVIKAVIFNDEKISTFGNEGGTGKGLNMHAVSQIRNVCWIDGKTFKFDDKYRYQSMTPATDIVVYDDVHKKFSIENLYSTFSEGYTKEGKYRDSVKLTQAIKSAITTNHALAGDSASDLRRKFEVEISPYYSDKYSPINEFGHEFFNDVDWCDTEWIKFDNYMLFCIQLFLQNGLVESVPINLAEKKLIISTCPEFAQFADGILTDCEHDKEDVKKEFVEQYPDYNNPIFKQRTFTTWLEIYAKHREWTFATRKSNGKGYFTFITTGKDVAKKSVGVAAVATSKVVATNTSKVDTKIINDVLMYIDRHSGSSGLSPHEVKKALNLTLHEVLQIRKELQRLGYIESVNDIQMEFKHFVLTQDGEGYLTNIAFDDAPF